MPDTILLNDPLYGAIVIEGETLPFLIQHPYMQRLRRIRQLGLMEYVYPSATHTRFQHAIGTMHIMRCVLEQLKRKGQPITTLEYQAALQAALLHDIGHSPLSHTLENILIQQTSHEDIGILLLDKILEEGQEPHLNTPYSSNHKPLYKHRKHKDAKHTAEQSLTLSKAMLQNTYERPFFHELLHGPLDVDRLDYLHRDCFFTGISEGTLGLSRLIHTLNVHKDQLVIEEKAIYSLENFFHAHRLMYLQGYFHKTTQAVDYMLKKLITRAQALCQQPITNNVSNEIHNKNSNNSPANIENSDIHPPRPMPFTSPSLKPFFHKKCTKESLQEAIHGPALLQHFTALDDHDIWTAIKEWRNDTDTVLSMLAQKLLQRELFHVKPFLQERDYENFSKDILAKARKAISLSTTELSYLVGGSLVSYVPWHKQGKAIRIYGKDGQIYDAQDIGHKYGIRTQEETIRTWYVYYPKALDEVLNR